MENQSQVITFYDVWREVRCELLHVQLEWSQEDDAFVFISFLLPDLILQGQHSCSLGPKKISLNLKHFPVEWCNLTFDLCSSKMFINSKI